MKTLTLLTGLLLCNLADAQTYQYVPMPTNTATWQMVSVFGTSGPPHLFIQCLQNNIQFTLNGEDTLINGLQYKKVFNSPLPATDTAMAQTETFAFGMREENKKVYLSKSPTQPILDFDIQVGQQMNYIGKVLSIDTINIGGNLRKRFIGESDTAIEGIGYVRRGIDPGRYFPVSYNDCRLTCHTYKQQEIYNFNSVSCTVIYPPFPTGITNTKQKEPMSVHPNPFTDHLVVSDKRAAKAVFYNILGTHTTEITLNSGNINTSSLLTGLYNLLLVDKNGSIISRHKLLKE
jgi:hypothetical protein